MTGVNLIPPARLERRRWRARARAWLRGAGCYAIFLTIALAVSRFAGTGDDEALRVDLQRAKSAVAASQAAQASRRLELDEALQRLAASRAVGDPPDWSVLLGMLASATGPDIVLSECQIESARGDTEVKSARRELAAIDRPGVAATVELAGLGTSQQAVSTFLLELDRSPLFSDVRLRDTRREPFLKGSAIAFRVDFGLTPEGGAP